MSAQSFRNRQIVLAAFPQGMPRESDFRLVESELPPLRDGQILVRTDYVSVDPYMRSRMSGRDSYVPGFKLGDVIEGGSVGTVIESRHPDFSPGDAVAGMWGWQEAAVLDGGAPGLERVDRSLGPVSWSLGVLGMPGMTAYFGLMDLGKPKAGEQVFVSGAAGAVGSLAGQIAKAVGCRVAGSAGSAEKVRALVEELGFDSAFNYHETPDLPAALREHCPGGVDVYFDNVGGAQTDAVFLHLNLRGRIVLCGQIEQYNAAEGQIPMGPRLLFQLIAKRGRAEGFIVSDYAARYPEGRRQMAEWIREGKIRVLETIVDGLENTPKAFIGLFTGANIGKQLVRVAAE